MCAQRTPLPVPFCLGRQYAPGSCTGRRYPVQVSADDAVPDGDVLSETRGSAIGCAVLGTLLLGAVVALSSAHVATLLGGLFFAAWFGLWTWFFARRRQLRMWLTADRGQQRPHVDPGSAFRRGLMLSLVGTVAEIVVLVVFSRLWGLEAVGFVGGGIVIGVAVAQGLGARDLKRWQEEHHLVVYRRVGARWVAWTSRQARGRLIVIPADREPDTVTPSSRSTPCTN